ncbi:MAG TPA: GlsB/YeaQ/YmgE family stress response membrane protein [Ktedonobacteraceae bacterium]|nr:GlsB/YeaQ/YmgE family stress response membrane protein [Ktedonobacteraceae bacterium]
MTVQFGIYGVLTWLIVGALAGFLASVLVRGRGYGCLGNTIVGLIGAVVGGFVFNLLGIGGNYQFWGSVGVAFVGAAIFLFLLQALSGNQRK